jgi:uncharacterized protein YlxW (UPF0749 family)
MRSAAAEAMSRMGRAIRQLADVPATAAREAAKAIEHLADSEFDLERDPYDRPWQTLAESTLERKGGDTRILQRSDVMRGTLAVLPMRGAGLSVTIDSPAEFHQIGTKNMPKRMILPDNRGIPATWRDAITDAADAAFERTLVDV